jgi:transcription initiation factor TFIIIB Brf1 subunit/transcription initiation factor TFIIB
MTIINNLKMAHNADTKLNLDNIDMKDLDIDNLDDLDNLDCSKFFEDIYNNIIESTENDACDRSKCSRCNSSEFVEDYTLGIIVCSCGEVINNLYDVAPDNKNYDDDNKQEIKRYNKVTNELLPLSSLGTRLPTNIRGNLQKIQNWGAMPYRERSLYNDFKVINEKCEKLSLTKNIQNSANIFYRAAKSCKHQNGENEGKHIITRGKNNKGIQGGSIWIACKKNNTPISTKDIAEQFNLTIKELNKGIRNLIKLLGIKNMPVQINVIGSEEYVKKYCTEMNIKNEYMDQAIKIAKNIDKLNIITEHTQFSIAATSVLIMAELNSITNLTKKSLKNIFGVSNVTISKAYRKLERIKHILVDDQKVEKLVEKLAEINNNVVISDVIKNRMEKFGINSTNSTNKINTKAEQNNISEDEYYSFDEDDMIDYIEVPKKRLVYNKNNKNDKNDKTDSVKIKNHIKTQIICKPRKKLTSTSSVEYLHK